VNLTEPAKLRRAKRAGRPAKAERPPYDPERVLDAAVRVFNQRGYDGSSMEDIARETGLSKSSIYHHVSSKEELLARALERAFSPLLNLLKEDGAREGRPRDRLRYIIHRAVLITLEFAPEVELLQRIKGNTKTERDALKRRHLVDDAVAGIISDAVAARELRNDLAPDLLARLIFGMSNSLTQWYRPGGPLTPDDISHAISNLVFQGVRPK
jgi:AcrR family transcriptional regulator